MEISRKTKDKILHWICKKANLTHMFFYDNCLCFNSTSVVLGEYLKFYAFSEENASLIFRPKDRYIHILDILLDVSRKGFTISNNVAGSNYVKVLPPFTTLEQLLIEVDLDS